MSTALRPSGMTKTKIGAALVLATMLGAGVAQAATYDKPVEKEQSTEWNTTESSSPGDDLRSTPQQSTATPVVASTGGDTAPWKVPTESLPSSVPGYPFTAPAVTYVPSAPSTAVMGDMFKVTQQQREMQRISDELADLQSCIHTQQILKNWHC